jgi:phage terminase large subunit-like protein
MNEWCAPDDAIADPDDVEAACSLDGPLAPEQGRSYLATLDVGTRNDRTAVVIAHRDRSSSGSVVTVDRLQVWTPRPGAPVSLDDVRLWVTEMCRAYRARLVYDPSQAYLLVEQLRRAGVRTQEFVFSSASVGKLATAIMQALRGRLLRLPNDPELRKELLAVRLRETSPNVLRIDHVSGGHDDRVIAVAMAVHELTAGIGDQGWAFHAAYKREIEARKDQPPAALAQLPRLGGEPERVEAPERCSRSVDGGHRFQRWPNGLQCACCQGWRGLAPAGETT